MRVLRLWLLISIVFGFAFQANAWEYTATPEIEGGLMVKPQDQTVDPYTPAVVRVMPGSNVNCEVTEASDKDTWTTVSSDGEDDDTVKYKWTASGGGFVTTTNPSGDATAAITRTAQWKAPNVPGDYTLTCKIDDTPTAVTSPNTGTRNDGAVTRTVSVEVRGTAEIKVKRSGTAAADYSDSATVAVGGLSSSEHKADVQVIVKDGDGNPMSGIDVEAPTIQNKEGVDKDASISPSSATTDSQGKANFTFTSSDLLASVTLEIDGGESSANASINQQWTNLPNTEGDLSTDTWEYDDAFEYDAPSPITFRMALDVDGIIPITDHDIRIIITEIDGKGWDSDVSAYVSKFYMEGNIPQPVLDLVTYGKTNEVTSGKYVLSQTITSQGSSHTPFIISFVDFKAVDWGVYFNN